jgi:hypothetical protein
MSRSVSYIYIYIYFLYFSNYCHINWHTNYSRKFGVIVADGLEKDLTIERFIDSKQSKTHESLEGPTTHEPD